MSFRRRFPLFVPALASVLGLSLPAHAETPPVADRVEAPSDPTALRNAYPLSVGARSFIAPGFGIAGFGVGFDLAYSLKENLAVGAQHLEYLVDQGADPQYCERCVRNGRTTLAFVEGRLFPEAIVTPYARLGLGLSHVAGQLVSGQEGYTENNFSVAPELGLELHYYWASIRAFAFGVASPTSELDADPFVGYGVQLGARL